MVANFLVKGVISFIRNVGLRSLLWVSYLSISVLMGVIMATVVECKEVLVGRTTEGLCLRESWSKLWRAVFRCSKVLYYDL